MKKTFIYILIVLICLVAVFSFYKFYFNKKVSIIKNIPVVEKIPEPIPEPVPEVVKDITYHSVVLKSDKALAELTDLVGKENLTLVLGLNRIDAKFIQKGKLIVIPDNYVDWEDYSPFPKTVDSIKTVPKLILVSETNQAVAMYEYGNQIHWMPASTGKKSTPTPPGLYHTNWKGKSVTSTVDDTWVMPWYFNLDNLEGISMHQYELPGYAASHSCVRLREEDALRVYNWADQWILSKDNQIELAKGTPVILFGEYNYNIKSPWKNLPTNTKATQMSVEEIDEVVAPYLEKINKDTEKRAEVEKQG